MLPIDIGDIIAGLVLLRLDGDEISESEARKDLFDVVDAYGVLDIDPEAVVEMDLGSIPCVGMREKAKQSLMCLEKGKSGVQVS